MSVRDELRDLTVPALIAVVLMAVITLLARLIALVVHAATELVQRVAGIFADLVARGEDWLAWRVGMRVPLGARLIVMARGGQIEEGEVA